jgi:hypothetical protein
MSTSTQLLNAFEETPLTINEYTILKDAINNFCDYYNDIYQWHGLIIKNKKLIYLMCKQFEQDLEIMTCRYHNTTVEDLQKSVIGDDKVDCMDIESSFYDLDRKLGTLRRKLKNMK